MIGGSESEVGWGGMSATSPMPTVVVVVVVVVVERQIGQSKSMHAYAADANRSKERAERDKGVPPNDTECEITMSRRYD